MRSPFSPASISHEKSASSALSDRKCTHRSSVSTCPPLYWSVTCGYHIGLFHAQITLAAEKILPCFLNRWPLPKPHARNESKLRRRRYARTQEILAELYQWRVGRCVRQGADRYREPGDGRTDRRGCARRESRCRSCGCERPQGLQQP